MDFNWYAVRFEILYATGYIFGFPMCAVILAVIELVWRPRALEGI